MVTSATISCVSGKQQIRLFTVLWLNTWYEQVNISGWGTQGRCRYSAVSLITRFDFMAPVTRVITALQCIIILHTAMYIFSPIYYTHLKIYLPGCGTNHLYLLLHLPQTWRDIGMWFSVRLYVFLFVRTYVCLSAFVTTLA